jgi:putative ABC transport system permease protein
MQGLRADIVHALRHYLTTPASSAIAVAVLAAAMAVLAAFLAIWSQLALSGHPGFERSRELVTIARNDGRRMIGVTYGFIDRAAQEMSTVEALAGAISIGQTLERDGDEEQFATELVTAGFFPSLTPRIALGRPFDATDHQPDAAPVVVVSDRFWREQLGGRADALGRTLRIRGPNVTLRTGNAVSSPGELVREYRVVGVMAAGMTGTFAQNIAIWMAFEPTVEAFFPEVGGLEALRQGMVTVPAIARPARGASTAAIRTELRGRFADTTDIGMPPFPGATLDAVSGVVFDLIRRREQLTQLTLFLAGSVLLALVAACNVSLFLLSRAPGRQRELAIRMAVGAPLKRLARQLVTEAGVLVIAATTLGLVLALWITALIVELELLPVGVGADGSPFDWRVLAIVGGAALAITALVSLAPVAGLKRLGIAGGSRSVTARAGWTQRIAGTLQLCIAAMISGAALAFLWYLTEITRQDRGFDAANLLVVTMFPENPPGPAQTPEPFLQEREHRRALIAALPGVEDVGFSTSVPGQWRQMWTMQLAPPDQPDDTFPVAMQSADANFLPLLNARPLAGRLLEASDRSEIVVNETLARRTWGRVDVVGEILPMAGAPPNAPRWEVVGVIRDLAYHHPSEEQEPVGYQLASQLAAFEWAVVRTRRSVADFRREFQRLIDDREIAVQGVGIRPLDETWGQMIAADRARTRFTVAIALLVVTLAGFGYFGTQRFLVAAGRREYAILAALGAGPRALVRLVLARGLALGAPGLVLGALLAFITVAWLRGDFVSLSVSPFAITTLVVLAIAALLIISSIGPARQVRRTPPAPLLRQE